MVKSCSGFLHQTSVEIQKMSPDCLRSLRTWMSSYWNVNVDGSQDKGPIFSFHQFEEEPKRRSEQRLNLRKQGFSWKTLNSVVLFLLSGSDPIDALKSGLVKHLTSSWEYFAFFIWSFLIQTTRQRCSERKVNVGWWRIINFVFFLPSNNFSTTKPNSEITK